MTRTQQHGLIHVLLLLAGMIICVQTLAILPSSQSRFRSIVGTELNLKGANGDGPAPLPDENFAKRQPQTQTLRPGSMAEAIATQGRVPYGEESRKYRRTIYQTQDDWIAHRASFSIAENLKGGLMSGIIRRLRADVLQVTVVAFFVVLWNGFIGNQETFLPQTNLLFLPHLSLPWQPFTLSSPALALLLVFRTNTSYARWLEARMKWSMIQTHTINLARMASTFTDVTDPESAKALDRLMRTCWALPRCLVNRLSGPEDEEELEAEILAAFAGDDGNASSLLVVDNLLSAPDRPMAALMELSLALNDLPIDEKRRLEMDKSIIIIGECVFSCERIYTSPVPLVYTRHTGRFLSLWMVLLPFPLYDLFVERNSILTEQVFLESCVLVPAAAVLAIFLFGVQELSIQLEEPFSILPMQKFCDDIRATATAMKNRAIQECSSKSSV